MSVALIGAALTGVSVMGVALMDMPLDQELLPVRAWCLDASSLHGTRVRDGRSYYRVASFASELILLDSELGPVLLGLPATD